MIVVVAVGACEKSGAVKTGGVHATAGLRDSNAASRAASAAASGATQGSTSVATPRATRSATSGSTPDTTPDITSDTTPGAAAAPNGPRRVVLGDINLTGIGYDRGSVTAPVVVIDLSDFGCPYCAQFTLETYPVIEREYVKTGKVFFKYVPFVVGTFPHAAEATRMAECAADEGRFWPMVDHLYEAQAEWKRARNPLPLLLGIGGAAGANVSALDSCFRSPGSAERTRRANDVARAIGVRVTPSFLVNERPIEGALPLAEFRRVLDAALLLEKTKM